MEFSVSPLHVDIQFLVYVRLKDFMEPFGKVQPQRLILVAGLVVVPLVGDLPAYASQEQTQPINAER